MRELIYYVATSLDGYIAEADGSFAKFVWDDEVVKDFFDSYNWFDTVVMGRKTYGVAFDQGITDPYPNLETIVFSRTLKEEPHPNVAVKDGNVIETLAALKEKAGKPIWLCGGGELASQLYRKQMIDKLIIKLNPIVLGGGIPLFAGEVKSANLHQSEVKEYDCGISLRHYTIEYH
jgi:dihydrofolate reductase